MEMKKCLICGEIKPLSEFHKDSQLKDGRHTYCKNCRCGYEREHYDSNRCCQARKIYRQNNKEKCRVVIRKWHQEHPMAKKASDKLHWEIRKGNILKPNACMGCGQTSKRLHGHHYKGYEFPLDVQWLCPKCHKRLETCRKPMFF